MAQSFRRVGFEMPMRPRRYGGGQADVKGPGAAAVPETTRKGEKLEAQIYN